MIIIKIASHNDRKSSVKILRSIRSCYSMSYDMGKVGKHYAEVYSPHTVHCDVVINGFRRLSLRPISCAN
jgi:hypothetical protein